MQKSLYDRSQANSLYSMYFAGPFESTVNCEATSGRECPPTAPASRDGKGAGILGDD